MVSFKSFVFLLIISTVACDEVVKFVRHELVDKSVEPCDNFYRHVCSTKTKKDFKEFAIELTEREIKQNFESTDNVSAYLNELSKCSLTKNLEETISKHMKLGFQSACERGEETKYLKKLQESFKLPSTTCENATKLYAAIDNLFESLDVEWYQNCFSVMSIRERLWLHKNKNTVKVLQNIFDDVKSIYRKWIQETPYLTNHNVTEKYLEIVDSLELLDESESKYIAFLTEKYEECKETIAHFFEDSSVANLICIQTTGEKYKSKQHQSRVNTIYNMYNDMTKKVEIRLPFFALAKYIDIRPFLLGQIGSVIGRQIGRSIIGNGRNTSHPLFSNRTANCIRNQFLKTCYFYPEYQCDPMGRGNDQNGADLLATRGALFLAKQEFGSKFYQSYDVYNNLTNAELFFYGLASTHCISGGYDEIHTPHVFRFNSMAAQNPEFQKTFQCEPYSKNVDVLHNRCYIVGEETSPKVCFS